MVRGNVQKTAAPATTRAHGADPPRMAIRFNPGPLPRLIILVVAVVAMSIQILGAYGWSKSFSVPAALFVCLQLQKMGIL